MSKINTVTVHKHTKTTTPNTTTETHTKTTKSVVDPLETLIITLHPHAKSHGDSLAIGQTMPADGYLQSKNGLYGLLLTTSGDLSLVYATQGDKVLTYVWSFKNKTVKGPFILTYDANGDVIVSGHAGAVVWHSGTKGLKSTELMLENDGTLVLLHHTTLVWSINSELP
ncbi:MAG: hypothetical protein ACYCPT_12945 [Acidimicrobiales bacterium]